MKEITGLDNLCHLGILNLERNAVAKVSGLAGCKSLVTLILKQNALGAGEGQTCVESLAGLLEVPSIRTLDISLNNINDPEVLPEILMKMPNLAVLTCKGNDFCQNIENFRKTLIAKIPTLEYLNERPVLPEDRRLAEAFFRGQVPAERAEKKLIREEEQEKHVQAAMNLQEMVQQGRKEK